MFLQAFQVCVDRHAPLLCIESPLFHGPAAERQSNPKTPDFCLGGCSMTVFQQRVKHHSWTGPQSGVQFNRLALGKFRCVQHIIQNGAHHLTQTYATLSQGPESTLSLKIQGMLGNSCESFDWLFVGVSLERSCSINQMVIDFDTSLSYGNHRLLKFKEAHYPYSVSWGSPNTCESQFLCGKKWGYPEASGVSCLY